MHLDDFALGDHVEGRPDPRPAVEDHLAHCQECQRLVEGLTRIRRAAASLPPMEPPARVWRSIERAIAGTGGRGASPRSRWKWWLAATAAAGVAVLVGIRFGPGDLFGKPEPGSHELVASVEIELRDAEAHYQAAIRGLEAIAQAEDGALDPATAEALQRNLAVVERAIEESRIALTNEPGNIPAQRSLLEGLKTKVMLLQETVSLITLMKDGSELAAPPGSTPPIPNGRG
jgi:anti-sigma factor RsiW